MGCERVKLRLRQWICMLGHGMAFRNTTCGFHRDSLHQKDFVVVMDG